VLDAVRESELPVDAVELVAAEIADRIRQLASSGVRRIAVAGGDGTVAGAAEVASSLSVEIAIIPGGTLNHLAKDLEIPDEIKDALDLAVNGEARPIDGGTLNGRLFLNTSSVGTYVTFVGLRDRLERWLGYRLASIVAGIRLFIRPRVFTVEVEIEGTLQRYVTPLVFVGVGERELKLPTLGGRAKDGQRGLHLLIVRRRSPARIAALALAAAARGTRTAARMPSLDSYIVDRFSITMRRARGLVAADGELHLMTAPLDYVWVRDAVHVVGARWDRGGRSARGL
jgi:diacylglycerol kinase family enzyme